MKTLSKGRKKQGFREFLRKPLTRSQVKQRVLGMTEKIGLLSTERLASWFVSFINAPEGKLSRLKDEAEFIASTKGGGALKEKITDQYLAQIRGDVQELISWATDKNNETGSLMPLDRISVDLSIHRVGNELQQSLLALDFRGRLLLRLFDLLSGRAPFARCAQCQEIFARRGRRIYCSTRCLDKARPADARKKYFREYMKERRANAKRLGVH
jgi:hypothetical protein